MTERGLPSVEGSPACPFVAFEDDRDERADRPDHRHRCFAEPVPAPRALAHQEAYCLSSAFPVCPTFQDWARRESARARGGGAEPTPTPAPGTPDVAATAATTAPLAGAADDEQVSPEWRPGAPVGSTGDDATEPLPPEPGPRRNPPRDWAAPPPWATGAAAAAAPEVTAPDFIERRSGEGQGLAGSPADRIATGQVGTDPAPAGSTTASGRSPEIDADPELAGLVAGAAAGTATPAGPGGAPATSAPGAATAAGTAAAAVASATAAANPDAAYPPSTRSGKRPAVSSTRAIDPARDRERERDRAAAADRGRDGPSWERSRRSEAYPTIRSRAGIPDLPRVGVLAVALLVAAIALFFLPQLLDLGGKGGAGASPSSTARPSATAAPSPTPKPEPTQQTYTVKQGDTLSKIAKKFGVSLDDLLAANKETVPDADQIAIGDTIIIPAPAPDVVTEPSASA